MAILVWVIFILYYLLLAVILVRWQRLTRAKGRYATSIKISVVIPVRNESETITGLLRDLTNQTLLPDEVIVVNDHSTDQTAQVVENWMQQHAWLPVRMIDLNEGEQGKKKAITAAVAQARGEVIVTTDGDCRVGEEWLQSVAAQFSSDTVKMVAGAVKLKANTFFGAMQQLEQAALTGTAAAFISLGMPVMCSGANLAYRRVVFSEVNGYEGNEHVASGDDEFLLKKIRARYPGGIVFNADLKSVVISTPVKSISELIHQRVRWAGKWRNEFGISSWLAMFIFVVHLTFLSLPLLAMAWVVSLGTVSILVLIKLFLELIFLKHISNWMKAPVNVHAFVVLQFLYPPYVVFFALISNGLKPTWKGRKI
jgi:cellulose synthase/poly-beta-1,6-N-acetylglucosamine synthase-like glycosyltransferase